MRWSKDKPTVRGWYWYRGDYHASPDEVQPVVIYVAPSDWYSDTPLKEGEAGRLVAWQPFMDYSNELDAFEGEWSGPIQPPPEL